MGHSVSKDKKNKASSYSYYDGSKRSSSTDSLDSAQFPTSSHHPKQNSKNKMPLFRRQSEKARKKLEHQQYLATENPEPIFDISNCEISDVPSGVYSLCRVLQKEVLLMHDNWLGSLTAGGSLTDLKNLRVLDVHNNEIKIIPDDIGSMMKLQVLNLEGNKISKIPNTIENLRHLQTLSLKSNRLKILPESLCCLPSLRTLDISENEIKVLPKKLCNLKTLETLIVDVVKLDYPSPEICARGTETIMKFLCSECGVEYQPPSNFLLETLPSTMSPSPTHETLSKALVDEENLMKSLKDYNNQMERKKQERIELERQLQEEMQQQATLAALVAEEKYKWIDALTKDQDKIDRELEELSHKKEEERHRMVDYIKQMEEGTNSLIKQILAVEKKAKKMEAILESIEKERIEKEEWFIVRWEEYQNIRKQEVLAAMESILQESAAFENLRQEYTDNKDNVLKLALESEEAMSHGHVESALYHKEVSQNVLMDILQKQEQLQRDAFEALQLQRDTKNQRITQQIALIQEELANLTVVELKRKDTKMEEEVNLLAEKRVDLIALLTQLMEEQEARQIELRHRLNEMEQLREDGQKDYWLVQYQRLMDRKPQSLIDQEHLLELAVISILENSNAEDYIPLFARHRITIETLLQMDENDMKQMGIHELGVRKAILKNVDQYRFTEGGKMANNIHKEPDMNGFEKKEKVPSELTVDQGASESPEPSAPPPSIAPVRQTSLMTRGINSECVVCMDGQSGVVFLNCGHVCTCINCSPLVRECPLCRGEIVQRIKLICV